MDFNNADIACITDKRSPGITLIELIIVMAIIGILASIAMPVYIGYQKNLRIERAISDIRSISLEILKVRVLDNIGPASLSDVGYGNYLDPWGNPYQFYNIVTAQGKGQMRKDKFLVPINSDFDLYIYSMGKDGQSLPPLNAPVSKDDIIRANDGDYIGLAEGY